MAGSITAVKAEHRSRGVIKIKAAVTCDASGDASTTVIGVAYGKIVAIGYKPGTFDTGVDLTLTDDNGTTLFSLTNAATSARYFRPTAVIATNAGAAITAADTAPNVNRDIYVAGKLKLVAAQGGNLGAGELHIVVDESDLMPETGL